MDYLIVGQGQYVFLVVKIQHGEGKLVIVTGAVHGCALEILKSVVHPAQVPFVVKAQSAVKYGSCYLGIGRGILGGNNRGGVTGFETAVHVFQELYGSSVLAAALVAVPVYHIADSVHAEPVKVVDAEPVVRRRLYK